MKKNWKFFSGIALVAIMSIFYIAFLVEANIVYVFIIIGSVAVLSTSMTYTVIHHIGMQDERERESRMVSKSKSIKTKSILPLEDIVKEYLNAMPYLQKYIDSEESYETIDSIKELIFTIFNLEQLEKINLLDLSKIEKIQLIREMLYFDEKEREELLESMIKNRFKNSEEISYDMSLTTVALDESLRLYAISLVEPGEKRKLIIGNKSDIIGSIKEKIGEFFKYKLEDFLVSSGGIILEENLKIEDYNIEDEDQIVLIPSKIPPRIKENKTIDKKE